jgi:hypothetical protein
VHRVSVNAAEGFAEGDEAKLFNNRAEEEQQSLRREWKAAKGAVIGPFQICRVLCCDSICAKRSSRKCYCHFNIKRLTPLGRALQLLHHTRLRSIIDHFNSTWRATRRWSDKDDSRGTKANPRHTLTPHRRFLALCNQPLQSSPTPNPGEVFTHNLLSRAAIHPNLNQHHLRMPTSPSPPIRARLRAPARSRERSASSAQLPAGPTRAIL